mgnify:CR=1 FL=1
MEYKQYYIYILSNYSNSTIYIGVTNNLVKRLYQHQNKLIDGFTSKYNINKLVYYEIYQNIDYAINREKQLKGWSRAKKNALIETLNPTWKDLGKELNIVSN